jgi:hypothetical protein
VLRPVWIQALLLRASFWATRPLLLCAPFVFVAALALLSWLFPLSHSLPFEPFSALRLSAGFRVFFSIAEVVLFGGACFALFAFGLVLPPLFILAVTANGSAPAKLAIESRIARLQADETARQKALREARELADALLAPRVDGNGESPASDGGDAREDATGLAPARRAPSRSPRRI